MPKVFKNNKERDKAKQKRKEYMRALMRLKREVQKKDKQKQKKKDMRLIMNQTTIAEIKPKRNIYDRTAIIIPYLNEPKKNIEMTLKSLNDTAPFLKQYWIEDTNKEGTSPMRHKGTMQAFDDGFDFVINIDAHMRFEHGTLYGITEHLASNPMQLTNINCYHNPTCTFNGSKYRGAKFTKFASHNNTYTCFNGQWRLPEEDISCIMGACYGVSKELYMKMGQPWRLNSGWGLDEEVMSLCCHFVGGSIEHLDLNCAHLFRTKGRTANSKWQEVAIWANRFQLLHLLPISDKERQQYINHMLKTSNLAKIMPKIEKRMELKREVFNEIKQIIIDNNVSIESFYELCRSNTKSGISLITPEGHANETVANLDLEQITAEDKNIERVMSVEAEPVPPVALTKDQFLCKNCACVRTKFINGNGIVVKHKCPRCFFVQ